MKSSGCWVVLTGHGGESPAVVGMEQNDVRLDAQLQQLFHAPIQVAEMVGAEAGEIPAVARGFPGVALEILGGEHRGIHGRALVGIGARLPQVIVVMLGKYAEADFVERI